MPHQACVEAGGGDVATLDVNGDSQVDIRTLMIGGRPRCRETDANFDGRVDIYRWFDSATGNVERVEDDYDFDGRIDVVATFEGGVVVRDVLDTNFDGRTDTWRDYRNGRVSELRRDADGDGRVDTWERFDDAGRITFEATDANRDGQPDPPSTGGYNETGAAPGSPAPGAATPPATPAATPPAPTPPAPTPTPPTTPAGATTGGAP